MVFIGWNDLGDKTPPTDTGALLVKWARADSLCIATDDPRLNEK